MRTRLGTLLAECEQQDIEVRVADAVTRWCLERARRGGSDAGSGADHSMSVWDSIATVTDPIRYGDHELALHLGSEEWRIVQELAGDDVDLTGNDRGDLDGIVRAFQTEALATLGFATAFVQLVYDNELAPNEFCLRLQGLRFPPQTGLGADEVFVAEPPRRLRLIGATARPVLHPTYRSVVAVSSSPGVVDALDDNAASWLSPFGYSLLGIQRPLLDYAASLMTDQRVAMMLRVAFEDNPFVVSAAVDRHSIAGLARLVRALALDGVPLDEFPSVLSAILRSSRHDDDDTALHCERARLELRSTLIEPTTTVLPVFALDDELEGIVRAAATEDEIRERFVPAAVESFGAAVEPAIRPAVLVPADLRNRIANAIRVEFPELRVLSYRDVALHKNVIPVGALRAAG